MFVDLAEFPCFYTVLAWPDHKIVRQIKAKQFYDQVMQELRKNSTWRFHTKCVTVTELSSEVGPRMHPKVGSGVGPGAGTEMGSKVVPGIGPRLVVPGLDLGVGLLIL